LWIINELRRLPGRIPVIWLALCPVRVRTQDLVFEVRRPARGDLWFMQIPQSLPRGPASTAKWRHPTLQSCHFSHRVCVGHKLRNLCPSLRPIRAIDDVLPHAPACRWSFRRDTRRCLPQGIGARREAGIDFM